MVLTSLTTTYARFRDPLLFVPTSDCTQLCAPVYLNPQDLNRFVSYLSYFPLDITVSATGEGPLEWHGPSPSGIPVSKIWSSPMRPSTNGDVASRGIVIQIVGEHSGRSLFRLRSYSDQTRDHNFHDELLRSLHPFYWGIKYEGCRVCAKSQS